MNQQAEHPPIIILPAAVPAAVPSAFPTMLKSPSSASMGNGSGQSAGLLPPKMQLSSSYINNINMQAQMIQQNLLNHADSMNNNMQ